MDKETIAVNPDGKISYLQINNPYKEKCTQETDIELNNNISRIQINNENFFLNTNLLNDAIILEQKSRFVKWICIFDGFISVLNLGINNQYAILSGISSISGYYGASAYKRKFLSVYICYQSIEICGKCIMIYTISKINYILFMLISIFIDIFILKQFSEFYKLLPL